MTSRVGDCPPWPPPLSEPLVCASVMVYVYKLYFQCKYTFYKGIYITNEGVRLVFSLFVWAPPDI